jgi:hypothetical protein
MNSSAILLAVASLAVLILGLLAWRLTSSKSTLLNLLLASAFLLFAGYYIASGRQNDMNWLPSFLATMLCAGRAIGFLLRTRKEPELTNPALLVTTASVIALVGTFVAYKSVH